MNKYAVSVIMPCYNEETFIARAIESLMDDYVATHAEILVVDGMSTDNTAAVVADLVKKNYPVRLLQNKKQLQCYALNLGIGEARGETIVRVDAHSIYPNHYVKQLVNLLETTDAANVGGIMLPNGTTPTQQAIARAMTHPVGVGNAKFHLGNYKGYVDTVYLGTFKKDLFGEIGLYDTDAHPNEDAELNLRILKAGKKIYLDSSIAVEYFPRDTFKKLAIQYYRYGRGRAYTTTKHKQVTSFRQLAPQMLVLGLLASLIAGFLWHPFFFLPVAVYPLLVTLTALLKPGGKKTSLSVRFRLAAAFKLMHITWGLGFLTFFVTGKRFKGAQVATTEENNNDTGT